jgi:glyoxylase-like metal-dependent hydrolase (beta-lactamase superfamily II)
MVFGWFGGSSGFEDVGGSSTSTGVLLLRLACANVYLADGVLIDSGTRADFGIIKAAIARLGTTSDQRLHAHAITHAHPDHQVGGWGTVEGKGLMRP